MRNRHDRLTKCGIVALASIAVLGWVREPDIHQSFGSSVSATSPARRAESRATFYPPLAIGGEGGIEKLQSDNPGSVGANDTVREIGSLVAFPPTIELTKRSPIEVDQRTSAAVITPAQAPANRSRPEGLQASKGGFVTRSRESRRERPQDLEGTGQTSSRSEPPEVDGASTSRGVRTDNTATQTQPVLKKDRSTARSAAIVIGAAVAGAAIGAATGGGTGAAIGAISGSTGGYVYDRMTRRKGTGGGTPTVIHTDSDSPSIADEQVDHQRNDRGPSLARQFGTPTFNGR